MNIIGSSHNNSAKLLVEGEFISQKDSLDFLAFTDEDKPFCQEITFLDTKKLPAEVVKRIAVLQEKGTALSADEKILWSYLNTLGIKTSYKNPYVSNDKKPIISALAIGGSAGCIEIVIEILKNLVESDIAIFIVIHIKEDAGGSFAKIFEKYAPGYKVKEGSNNEPIEPRTIYTAPANRHMVIKSGYIFLTDEEKDSYSRPSINVTFESLAKAYGDELASVLLCGYGDDGSRSLKSIKEAGGKVLLLEDGMCFAKDMLKNAIKTGNYTDILPIRNIIKDINAILLAQAEEDLPDRFLDDIFSVYGYDFRNYERKLIKRRVLLTKKRVGINDTEAFCQAVLKEADLFKELFFDFSINVTAFFRDSGVYKTIRDKVLPYISSYPEIKIWCAGCSTGEEPYSLAIMLDEMGMLEKSTIYATDFNTVKLQEAKNGLFSKDRFDAYRRDYILSGGAKEFESYFEFEYNYAKIVPRIKRQVVFFKHNLTSDGVFNEFQLIMCRNVMIYFDDTLRKKVYSLIDDSLSRNGFLVLGSSEMMTDGYKPVNDHKDRIYQKKRNGK